MLLPDDAAHTPEAAERTTEPIERPSRPPTSHREAISERRQHMLQQKHTDSLPRVNGDTPSGKIAWRQVIQLREENKRLHWEFNALQAEFDKEMAVVHRSHQQEIEQYQQHLRDMMEERNHMQEAYLELEQRYQELYHSFQNAVEEEAHKMITEAVQTVELTPEHTPVLLRDIKKTLELQARQGEDYHVAQALYLMREAQRKAQQLEQELDRERKQMMTEHQNLVALQNSVRTQAKLRFDTQKAHLQAKWTLALTATVWAMFLVLPILQGIFYSLGLSLVVAFLAPIFICLILAFITARLWVSIRHLHESTPQVKKQT